jgi:hypothetical protein
MFLCKILFKKFFEVELKQENIQTVVRIEKLSISLTKTYVFIVKTLLKFSAMVKNEFLNSSPKGSWPDL